MKSKWKDYRLPTESFTTPPAIPAKVVTNTIGPTAETEVTLLNRRDHVRYLTYQKARLKLKKIGQSISIQVDDVSRAGFRIVTRKKISEVEKITWKNTGQSTINLPVQLYEFRGKINRTYLYILTIKSSSDDSLSNFYSYLDELSPFPDRRNFQIRRKGTREQHGRRIVKNFFLKCIKYNRTRKLIQKDHYFFFREFQSSTGSRITRNQQEMLMFGSNNYLGLANHPAVVEAMTRTAKKYGVGSGGSRILCGTTDIHNKLEKKIAEFIGGEDCMTFSSGYGGNVGLLSGLLTGYDYVLTDSLCHASITDGVLLSGGNRIT